MVKVGELEVNLGDENERYVAGWASVEVPDLEDDIIPINVLFKAMKKYMDEQFNGRISYAHTNKTIGKVIYWDIRRHPLTNKPGVYIIAKLFRNDVADKVWEALKQGRIHGFSVGGTGEKKDTFIEENGVRKVINVVTDLEIHEISLAEIPANQFSTIEEYSLAKALDNKKDVEEALDGIKKVRQETINIDERLDSIMKAVQEALEGIKEIKEIQAKNDLLKKLEPYPLLKTLIEGGDIREVIDDEEMLKAVIKDEIIEYVSKADDYDLKNFEQGLALAIARVAAYMPSDRKIKESMGMVEEKKAEEVVEKPYTDERMNAVIRSMDWIDRYIEGLDNLTKELRKMRQESIFEKARRNIEKYIEMLKDSCKSRYYNEEEGHFKGRAGTGERFNNCVKYFMNCKGLSEDAARRQCAEIARKKYGNAFHKSLDEVVEKILKNEELTDEDRELIKQFDEELKKGNGEIIDEDEEVEKPDDVRPPKKWLEDCKRKTGSTRLCAWVYWHHLKPNEPKKGDDDPETREARQRKKEWLEERVSKAANYTAIKDDFVDFLKKKFTSTCQSNCEKKTDAGKVPAFVEWLWNTGVEGKGLTDEQIKARIRSLFSFKDDKIVESLTDVARVRIESARDRVAKEKVEKDEGVPSASSGEAYVNPTYSDTGEKKRKKKNKFETQVQLKEYLKQIDAMIEKIKIR